MINILEALQRLKGSVSEENYNKIIKILEEDTGCGFTEEMRKNPSFEALKYAKKYLPEGKMHCFDEMFSDKDLAVLVNSQFLIGTFQLGEKKGSEEQEASKWWLAKEIAYQTVRRLAGDKKIPCLIKNEDDWKRFFFFDESRIKT